MGPWVICAFSASDLVRWMSVWAGFEICYGIQGYGVGECGWMRGGSGMHIWNGITCTFIEQSIEPDPVYMFLKYAVYDCNLSERCFPHRSTQPASPVQLSRPRLHTFQTFRRRCPDPPRALWGTSSFTLDV